MSQFFTDTILLRSLFILLLLGSIAGLLAGLILLLKPAWLMQLGAHSNRWVSTRQLGRSLDSKVSIDHWFYRYGHLSGGLLLGAAVYIVYMFTVRVVRTEMLADLAHMQLLPGGMRGPLLDTLVLVLLAGAVLGGIVGLFLLFRPSMLRDLEQGANQTVSLRQSLKPLEVQHANMDQLVLRNARLFGVVLLCGSIYTLAVFAYWYLR